MLRPNTGGVDQLPERPTHDRVAEAFVGLRHEEAWLQRPRFELVAEIGVSGQRVHGSAVKGGNEPGFAELGLADQQHAPGPVDVAAVKRDGFSDPQTTRRQQSDQRLVGRGAQW